MQAEICAWWSPIYINGISLWKLYNKQQLCVWHLTGWKISIMFCWIKMGPSDFWQATLSWLWHLIWILTEMMTHVLWKTFIEKKTQHEVAHKHAVIPSPLDIKRFSWQHNTYIFLNVLTAVSLFVPLSTQFCFPDEPCVAVREGHILSDL